MSKRVSIRTIRAGLRAPSFNRFAIVKELRALGMSDREIVEILAEHPFQAMWQTAAETIALAHDNWAEGDPPIHTLMIEDTVALETPLGILLHELISDDLRTRRIAGNTIVARWSHEFLTARPYVEAVRPSVGAAINAVFSDPEYPTADVLGAIARRFRQMVMDQFECRYGGASTSAWSWLHEADGTIATALSIAIQNCGPRGGEVLPEIGALFSGGGVERRLGHVAAHAMLSIGSPARGLMDEFLRYLFLHTGGDYSIPYPEVLEKFGLSPSQLAYVASIAEFGEQRVSQNPMDRVAYNCSFCRDIALDILRALGERAAPVADVVQRIADSEGHRHVGRAMEALAAIEGDDSGMAAMLLARSRDEDRDTRFRAARALGGLRRPNDDVLDRLMELANLREWDDWYVRGAAIESLGRLGRRIDQVLPRAIEMLDDFDGCDSYVFDYAVDALGCLGPAAAPAVPALLNVLEDKETGAEFGVIDALRRVGPPAAAALDRLRILRCTTDRFTHEIEMAVEAIAGL